MNEERNTGQQGKSGTYKRANRHGRNRPVLVTGASPEQASSVDAQAEETSVSTPSEEIPTVTEESPVIKKNRPHFFSTVGRKEETAEAKETEAAAARLARATRGKAAAPGKKEPKEIKETREPKKPEPKAVVKSAPSRTAPPPRRGFKPRHLIGILAYLLVAEFVGGYERVFLANNGLEKLLFTIGPFQVTTSIVVFLLTLIILLIVLARLDLVPRSLTPAPSQPRTQGKSSSAQDTSDTDFGSGRNTPSLKKGVKGADDDLYQEYRETQRYLQRRERKK